MVTRKDKIDQVVETLDKRHNGNLIRIFGTGSYFHKDLDTEYQEGERPIDLHLVVRDLDDFYLNHIITEKELEEFGISKYDLYGIEETLAKFRDTNELVPLYHLNKEDGYRITVVPFDKLGEWISKDSPIGNFLTGRWQKPLAKLYDESDPVEELALDRGHFPVAYDTGVRLAFETLGGEQTFDEIIQHIYGLSYASEGIRGLEGILRQKHKKIFEEMKAESREIYDDLIRDEIWRHSYEVFEDGEGKSRITYIGDLPEDVEKMAAKERINDFKEWSVPRYCRVLWYLQDSFPNTDDYAKRKMLRGLGFKNDKSKVGQAIVGLALKPLKNYMYKNIAKLPEELQPEEFKEMMYDKKKK
jgi:hypothetical protein